MLAVLSPLAVSLVLGFSWGMITSSSPTLPSASARSVVKASPAPTVDPVRPVEVVEEVQQFEEDWGEPSVDDAWPVDEKGDGCDAPVWPAAAPDAPRVLLIGDSLFRNSRALLEESLTADGWVPTVRCWGAKGTDWGAGQVQRAAELGQLPDTVVVSFGTNDIWWLGIPMEDAVDQMMWELGPDRTVYWINLWFDQTAYDDLPDPTAANAILEEKAREYPNLQIIDFAGAFEQMASAGANVGWTDGVHLNATAEQLRVDVILAALDG